MPNALELVGRGLLTEMASVFEGFTGGCADDTRSGYDHLIAGRFEPARASFQSALAIDPHDVGSLIGTACILDQQGETHEAAASLEAALQREPNHAAALFALGFCRERSGETWSAEEAYRAAVAADPGLRNAHERLAAIYLRRGAVDQAIDHHEIVHAGAPSEVNTLLTLAHLYAQVGRHEEAVVAYQRVLALDPHSAASDDLVSACIKADRIDDGIAHLERLVRGPRGCAADHLRLGELHERRHKDEDAMQAYVRAAALDPDSIEAALRLGTLHLRHGRYAQAESWFAQAIDLNDRVIEALVGLGVTQEALGRHRDALATFQTAAGAEPNSTQLFAETARIHLSAAAARQADRYLAPRVLAGVQDDPGVIVQAEAFGSVFTDQIAMLRGAVRLHPNHADLHYRLGMLLRQAGDVEGAIDAYHRAVSINPDYVDARLKLGIALRERGHDDAAIDCFKQALSIDPEAVRLHYELGLIFADRAMWDRAVDHFEQAAESQPSNVEFQAHLALSLQNMGLIERAELCWQTLRDIAERDDAGRALLDGARRSPGLSAHS